MAEIIAGSGLGRFDTIGLNAGKGTTGQAGDLLAVNVANGNLISQRADQFLASVGFNVDILRTYNSQGRFTDANGDNFRFSFNQLLFGNKGHPVSPLNDEVFRTGGDGNTTRYAKDGGGTIYVSTDGGGAHDSLQFNKTEIDKNVEVNEWIWIEGSSQTGEVYDSDGRLIALLDREGVGNYNEFISLGDLSQLPLADRNAVLPATHIYYDDSGRVARIEDPSGQVIALQYASATSTSVVAVLTQSAGGSSTWVRYAYDSDHRLVRVTVDLSPDDSTVTDGNVFTTEYTYDGSSKRIAGISQSDGTEVAVTYVQDPASGEYLVKTITRGTGDDREIQHFDYDLSGRRTDVTQIVDVAAYAAVDADLLVSGNVFGLTTSVFYDAHGQVVRTLAPPDANSQRIENLYRYDGDGNLVEFIDGNGHATATLYDDFGNAIEVRNADGDVVRRTYDASNRLVREAIYAVEDADGDGFGQPAEARLTHFLYDDANRLRFLVESDGTVIEHRYDGADASAQVQSTITYTVDRYDLSYLIALAEADLAATAGAAFFERWNDIPGQDVVDLTTRGTPTVFNFDRDGTYPFTPDETGVLPSLEIASDSGDLYGMRIRAFLRPETTGLYEFWISSDGESQLFLSADGNPGNKELIAEVERSNLNEHDWDRWAVQHSRTIELEAGETYYLEILFKEDKQSDHLSVAWANDQGLGRQVVDGRYLSFFTGWTPTNLSLADLEDWVANVADRSQAQRIDREFDFRGQLSEQTRFMTLASDGSGILDGREETTRYIYDQAGNLLQEFDARGNPTTYVYDGLNRLLSVTDALGRVTSYIYDDGNQSIVTTLANGYRTLELFDSAGHLRRIAENDVSSGPVMPLGQEFYYYDDLGRLVKWLDQTGVASYRIFDEQGRVSATVDGTGAVAEFLYDGEGNAIERIEYAERISLGSIDQTSLLAGALAVAALRPSASTRDRHVQSVFDARDGQIFEIDGEGYVSEFVYDGTARLIAQIRYDQRIFPDREGPLSEAAVRAALATAYPDNDFGDTRIELSGYDSDGKLRFVLNGENYLTEYRYDAADQEVETIQYATAVSQAVTIADLTDVALIDAIRPVADPFNDIHRYNLWNRTGAVAAQISATGVVSTADYDVAGNLTGVTTYATPLSAADLQAALANAAGDAARLQLADVLPTASSADQLVTYEYDSANRRTAEQEVFSGNRTDYEFDLLDNVTRIIAAAGTGDARISRVIYDVRGNAASEISPLAGDLGEERNNTYDDAGRLVETIDEVGSRTLYYYDAADRQVFAVNGEGEVTERVYNAFGNQIRQIQYANRIDPSFLPGLTGGLTVGQVISRLAPDSANDRVTVIDYDRRGDDVQSIDGEGYVTDSTRNAFGNVSQIVRDVLGSERTWRTFEYDRRGLLRRNVSDAAVGANAGVGLNLVNESEYDAFGRAVRLTDGRGNVTEFAYDRAGRQIAFTDTLGPAETQTFDAFSRVLTVTNGRGDTNTYTYSDDGLAMTVTTPRGTQIVTVSNAFGEVVETTNGNGETTRFEYDANGNITKVTDPLGIEVVNEYDAANRVVSSTDENGVVTVLTYDAANRVLTETLDPGGRNLQVRYEYDARGNGVRKTDPNGVVSEFSWDRNDNVLRSVRDPGGVNIVREMTWDALGRNISLVESTGGAAAVETVYEYDRLGRRVGERTGPAGVFAAAPGNSSNNRSRSFRFDDSDNVTERTDGDGNTSYYVYDNRNRLVFEVDPEGGVVERRYDNDDNLKDTIRYAETILVDPVQMEGNGARGHVTSLLQPSDQDQRDRFVLDRDDRVVFEINALGQVTRNTFDDNDNVLERRRYAAFTLDDLGLNDNQMRVDLIEAAISALGPDLSRDQREVRTYDADDRLLTYTDSLGNTETYAYDDAGNVLTLVDRRGNQWDYTYDEANRMVSEIGPARNIATTNGIESVRIEARFEYDNAGNLTRRVDAVGTAEELATEFTYDGANRVSTQTRDADGIAAVTRFTYDGADRVLSETAPSGATTHFAYDRNGQEVFRIDALGAVTETQYDGAGAVVATIRYASTIDKSALADFQAATIAAAIIPDSASDRAETFARDGNGRAVTVTDGENVASTAVYDAFDNVLTTTVGNRTVRSVYDQLDQLIYNVDGEGFVIGYAYDNLGNLVSETKFATAYNGGGYSASELAGFFAANADAAGDQVTHNFYDAGNRVRYSIDAEGYVTENVYDAADNILQQTRYATALGAADIASAVGTGVVTPPPSSPNDRTRVSSFNSLNALVNSTDWRGLTKALTYDGLNRVVQQDRAGGETRTDTIDYDGLGNVVASSNPLAFDEGVGVTNVFDIAGRLLSSTDEAGSTTWFYYDAGDRLTHTVNARGEVSAVSYNAFGEEILRVAYATRLEPLDLAALTGGTADAGFLALVQALADPSIDREIHTEYDRRGLTVLLRDAEGFKTELMYNDFGEVVGQIDDVTGNDTTTTAWAYDARGLQKSVTRDLGGVDAVESYEYDAFGRIVRLTDGRGNAADSGFDRLGRQVQIMDPTGATRNLTYDAFGRVLTETDRNGNTRSTAYDDSARATTVTYANGVSVTITDNLFGETVSFDDGNGNTTTYEYDKLGNVTKVTDALGNATNAAYDPLNRLVSSIDANGVETRYDYDAVGRVITETVDETGLNRVTSAAFDALGNQISTTDANGVVTESTYDRRGQVLTVVFDPSGLAVYEQFTYDGQGNVLTETRGSVVGNAFAPLVVRTFTYDNLGRRRTQSGDGENASYTFDANDNVTSFTDGNGNTTRWVYDTNDRLVYRIDPAGYVSEMQYDAKGNVIVEIGYATAIDTATPATMADVSSAIVADSGTDRLTRSVYDSVDRVRFRIDGGGYVSEFRYDANNNLVRNISYADRVILTGHPTVAEMSALTASALVTAATISGVDEIGDFAFDPDNVYRTLDVAADDLLVTTSAGTALANRVQINTNVAPFQPFPLQTTNVPTATVDASETVSVSFANGTVVESPFVNNGHYVIDETSGGHVLDPNPDPGEKSVDGSTILNPSVRSYMASRSVTGITARVFSGGSFVAQVGTETSRQVQVGTDEDDNPIYETRTADPWTGTFNLPDGLLPGAYTVHIDVTYDDGTDSFSFSTETGTDDPVLAALIDTNGNPLNVNIGTPSELPTVVTWTADVQPGNTTVELLIDGTPVTVSTQDGQHSASLGTALADGNYSFTVNYLDRDSSAVVRSFGGTFDQARGVTSVIDVLSTHSITGLAAGDRSTITGVIDATTARDVSRVEATVTPSGGSAIVVTTDPLLERQLNGGFYDGRINLSEGGALADGRYTVGVIVTFLDGSQQTIPTFNYEIGLQSYTSQNLRWPLSSFVLPPGGTVDFRYGEGATPGGSGAAAPVLVNGADYEVVFRDELNTVEHWFIVEYRDAFGHLLGSAQGNFNGQAFAGAPASADTSFTTDTFTVASTDETQGQGTSLDAYILPSDAKDVTRVDVVVTNVDTGAVVSNASTYVDPFALAGGTFQGDLNLSVGSPLPDARYSVGATVVYNDGTTVLHTFEHQIGQVTANVPLTRFDIGSVDVPVGTELVATLVNSSGARQNVQVETVGGTWVLSVPELSPATQGGTDLYDLIVKLNEAGSGDTLRESRGVVTVIDGGSTLVFSGSDIRSREERFFYDAANREVYAARAFLDDGDAIITETRYDAVGQVRYEIVRATPVTLAESSTTADVASLLAGAPPSTVADRTKGFVYDTLGRVTSRSINGVTSETNTYDNLDNVTSVTDASGNVSYFVYDSLGRQTHSFEALETTTSGTVFDGLGYATNTDQYRVTRFAFDANDGVVSEKLYLDSAGLNGSQKAEILDGTFSAGSLLDGLAFRETVREFNSLGQQTVEYVRDDEGDVLSLFQLVYDGFGRIVETRNAAVAEYDGQSQLVTDLASYAAENVSVTARTFDVRGQLTAETLAAGSATASTQLFAYNAYGELIAVTDPRGEALATQDDAWAQATRVDLLYAAQAADLSTADKAALRALYTSHVEYDRRGNTVAEIDALGNRRSIAYDAFGNPIRITSPVGEAIFFYFDDQNNLRYTVQPDGAVTEQRYDAAGNMTMETAYATRLTPGNFDEQSTSADIAALLVADGAIDRTEHYRYDSRHRLIERIDGRGNSETFTYDAVGNRISRTDQEGRVTDFLFDALGRLVGERQPDADGDTGTTGDVYFRETRYNLQDQVTRIGQLGGQDLGRSTYDAFGQQTSEWTIVGGLVNREFDLQGNLVREFDAAGNSNYFYYDAAGRQIASVDADDFLTELVLDPAGNEIVRTTYETTVTPSVARQAPATPGGAARVLRFEYDAVSQRTATILASETYFDKDTGFVTKETRSESVYDANGQVFLVRNDKGEEARKYYNAAGQEALLVSPEGTVVAYQYDAFGNRVEVRQFGVQLGASALTNLTADSSLASIIAQVDDQPDHDRILRFAYDQAGNKVEERLVGVGYTSIDNNGQDSFVAGDYVQLLIRDKVGNVTRMQQTGRQSGSDTPLSGVNTLEFVFVYDNLNRLVRQERPTFTDYLGNTERERLAYNYDFAGNLLSESVLSSAGDLTPEKSQTFTYDSDGRRQTESGHEGVFTYTYDSAGRLETITDTVNGTKRAFMYNGRGQTVTTITRDLSDNFIEASFERYNAFGQRTGRGRTGDSAAQSVYQEFWEYDAAGRVLRTNEATGVTRVYFYDTGGNRTAELRSIGTTSATSLDHATRQDVRDNTNVDSFWMIVTDYDGQGNAVDIFETAGSVGTLSGLGSNIGAVLTNSELFASNSRHTQMGYDPFNQVVSETDAAGNTRQFAYDARSNLVRSILAPTTVVGADGVATTASPTYDYYYDIQGRLIGERDARGYLTQYDYAGDRVSRVTFGDGATRETKFDARGDVREATNELGYTNTKTWDYSTAGQVTETRVLDDRQSLYGGLTLTIVSEYDGDMLSTTRSDGKTYTVTYDELGRQTQVKDFFDKVDNTAYVWDSAINNGVGGYRSTKTDALSNTSKFDVDVFGRIAAKENLSGRKTTYTFNQAGLTASESSDTTAIRLISGASGSAAGTMSLNNSAITYTYTNDGRASVIDDTATGITTSFTFDIRGNITAESRLANGVTDAVTVTYDEHNRIATAVGSANSQAAYNLTYDYDADGNILHVAGTIPQVPGAGQFAGNNVTVDDWYEFDARGRITVLRGDLVNGAIVRGASGYAFGYDAAGRRTSEVTAGIDMTVEYDDTSHKVTVKDGGNLRSETFYNIEGAVTREKLYTGSGSLARDTSKTYNSKGLVQAESYGGTSISFAYDAVGNLTRLVSSAEGTTSTTTYTYALLDSYNQRSARLQNSNPDVEGTWAPSFATTTFDANGNSIRVVDSPSGHTTSYERNYLGQIIERQTRGAKGNRSHYYFNFIGYGIGDSGNDSSTNRNLTLEINQRLSAGSNLPSGAFSVAANGVPFFDPGSGVNTISVQQGDTLQSLAEKIYGNSSFWYVLADANGLSPTDPLAVGQQLQVPALSTTAGSQLRDPPSVGETLGDTSPLATDPPPPPDPDDKECERIVLIVLTVVIVIIVAVVVTVITAGVAAGPAGLGATILIGAIVGAVGAAVVSASTQGIAIALGLQESFDWENFAIDVAVGFVTGGIAGAASFLTVADDLAFLTLLAIEVGSGIAEGLMEGVIRQTANVIKGEQWNWAALGVDVAVGAGSAFIGAAASKLLAKGVKKAATNVTKEITGQAGQKKVIKQIALAANRRAIKIDVELRPSDVSDVGRAGRSAVGDDLLEPVLNIRFVDLPDVPNGATGLLTDFDNLVRRSGNAVVNADPSDVARRASLARVGGREDIVEAAEDSFDSFNSIRRLSLTEDSVSESASAVDGRVFDPFDNKLLRNRTVSESLSLSESAEDLTQELSVLSRRGAIDSDLDLQAVPSKLSRNRSITAFGDDLVPSSKPQLTRTRSASDVLDTAVANQRKLSDFGSIDLPSRRSLSLNANDVFDIDLNRQLQAGKVLRNSDELARRSLSAGDLIDDVKLRDNFSPQAGSLKSARKSLSDLESIASRRNLTASAQLNRSVSDSVLEVRASKAGARNLPDEISNVAEEVKLARVDQQLDDLSRSVDDLEESLSETVEESLPSRSLAQAGNQRASGAVENISEVKVDLNPSPFDPRSVKDRYLAGVKTDPRFLGDTGGTKIDIRGRLFNKDVKRQVIAERGLIFEQRKVQSAVKKQVNKALDQISKLDVVTGSVNKRKLNLNDLVAFADVGDGKVNRIELRTKVRVDANQTADFNRTFTNVNFDVPDSKLRAGIRTNFNFFSNRKLAKGAVSDLWFINKKVAKTVTKGALARLILLDTPREVGLINTTGNKETAASRAGIRRFTFYDNNSGQFVRLIGDPITPQEFFGDDSGPLQSPFA